MKSISDIQIKLFISYSEKDVILFKHLVTHLKILLRTNSINEIWHDKRITAGSFWEKAIMKNLEEADIILILVSANYIASDFQYTQEAQIALKLQEEGKAKVISLIIKPCFWQDTDFANSQILPKGGKPITECDDVDIPLNNITKELKSISNNIRRYKYELYEEKQIESNIASGNQTPKESSTKIQDIREMSLPYHAKLNYYLIEVRKIIDKILKLVEWENDDIMNMKTVVKREVFFYDKFDDKKVELLISRIKNLTEKFNHSSNIQINKIFEEIVDFEIQGNVDLIPYRDLIELKELSDFNFRKEFIGNVRYQLNLNFKLPSQTKKQENSKGKSDVLGGNSNFHSGSREDYFLF